MTLKQTDSENGIQLNLSRDSSLIRLIRVFRGQVQIRVHWSGSRRIRGLSEGSVRLINSYPKDSAR
jgi:hypothetical protein